MIWSSIHWSINPPITMLKYNLGSVLAKGDIVEACLTPDQGRVDKGYVTANHCNSAYFLNTCFF